MARKFGFPTVAALEVGQHTLIPPPLSEVSRKVRLYGERNGKRFATKTAERGPGGLPAVVVTRLPDPTPDPQP